MGTIIRSFSGYNLDFDEVNDVVDTGKVLSLDRTDTFELEFWCYIDHNNTWYDIFHNVEDAPIRKGFSISKTDTNELYVRLAADMSDNNYLAVKTSTTVPDAKWFKCTIEYDGNSLPSSIVIKFNDIAQNKITLLNNLSSGITSTNSLKITALPIAEAVENFTALVNESNDVNLSWDDVFNEDYYELERSENGVSGWIVVDNNIPANTISYTDNPY